MCKYKTIPLFSEGGGGQWEYVVFKLLSEAGLKKSDLEALKLTGLGGCNKGSTAVNRTIQKLDMLADMRQHSSTSTVRQ
jgi:hypothetical protein